jgi:uncharacterized protein YcbX
MAHIATIYRYPIKGLSPELLPQTTLTPGQTVTGDRLYAIENGPSSFDPIARPYLPKTHFLMLMKNERLARLRCTFDHESHVLAIEPPATAAELGGGFLWDRVVRGDLRTADGRAAVEEFFAVFCADELRGPPKILHAPGHSFSDVASKVVSIINLASVAAIEGLVGVPVNPLRFRGNVYVDGWPAWSELDLVGKELTIGTARLKVVKRIVRCAATDVDPDTGLRDLQIPKTVMSAFGHADCGIYAEVRQGGEIAVSREVTIS